MAAATPQAFAPPPSRTRVAAATFASQLLGTFAFALALVWIAMLHVTEPSIIAVMIAGAAVVFAGGHAHRGNLVALVLCAAFDVTAAIALLARLPAAEAFAWPPLARIHAEQYLAIAMPIAGAVAALAAVACIAALPQARRIAAWRGEQILHAARVVRG